MRGTPEYKLDGAQMLDVVASGSRLVAVGWAETTGFASTGFAVWHSDDGGRTWEHAPESTFPSRDSGREELNRVVRAGDRLVAASGNRCCHDQPFGALWVADQAGERWRAVPLPERQTGAAPDLAVAGDAVHVVGSVDYGRELVHWRLAADDRRERLPDPPAAGRLLAGPDGFELVAGVGEHGDRRLVLFTSVDGNHFEQSRVSAPQSWFNLETALRAGDRLLVYTTIGEDDDQRRLLYTNERPR